MMKYVSVCNIFLFQLPAVYNLLFDAIGAIAEESCVYLEKLYQTQCTMVMFNFLKSFFILVYQFFPTTNMNPKT